MTPRYLDDPSANPKWLNDPGLQEAWDSGVSLGSKYHYNDRRAALGGPWMRDMAKSRAEESSKLGGDGQSEEEHYVTLQSMQAAGVHHGYRTATYGSPDAAVQKTIDLYWRPRTRSEDLARFAKPLPRPGPDRLERLELRLKAALRRWTGRPPDPDQARSAPIDYRPQSPSTEQLSPVQTPEPRSAGEPPRASDRAQTVVNSINEGDARQMAAMQAQMAAMEAINMVTSEPLGYNPVKLAAAIAVGPDRTKRPDSPARADHNLTTKSASSLLPPGTGTDPSRSPSPYPQQAPTPAAARHTPPAPSRPVSRGR